MAEDLLFPVRNRGDSREAYLDDYRWGLRQMHDPGTGAAFTDDQIAIATALHSEAWIKADGIDAVSFLNQQRALWMAAQDVLTRAAGVTLRARWATLWGLPYLEAAGGSGTVTAPCAGGTTFKGSTTIGDPAAVRGRDAAGLIYQVLFTATAGPIDTLIGLTLIAVSTGSATNIDIGSSIRWVENVPLTAPVDGTVVNAKFAGGIEAETDQQYVIRLAFFIRHKQGAGNRAQNVGWAFAAAQNAVGNVWVYGGAWHAGSALIAIASKRGNVAGPTARVPDIGTMTKIGSYLASVIPITPGPPAVVALPVVALPSDFVLSLAMALESSAGWADPTPWPQQTAGAAIKITALTDQTHFVITCLVGPPSSDVPAMMIWDVPTSTFLELSIASVTLGSPNHYGIVLNGPPTGHTLAIGDVISPWTEQASLISATLTAYADSLGAGEVIDVSAGSMDDRRGYAFRWPKPNEQDTPIAGTGAISYLQDAMGPALANVIVESVSVSTPPLPADPIDGPGLIVLGTVGIYAL